MMATFLAAQSALAVALARARNRSRVIRTITLGGSDSAPLRLLSRSVVAQTERAGRMERALAKHLAAVVRNFVQSSAFEAVLLAAITQIVFRIKKGGIR